MQIRTQYMLSLEFFLSKDCNLVSLPNAVSYLPAFNANVGNMNI